MPLLKSGISKLTDFTKKGYKNMKLKDFKMKPTKMPKGYQALLGFGDSLEPTIIQNEMSYGSSNGLYEIAVFKGDGQVEMPGITEDGDTVKGFLTEDDVDSIIKKMHTISGAVPVQV